MPMGLFHDMKDLLNKFNWDILMKKIAHRVYKDSLRFLPHQWQACNFLVQSKLKSAGIVGLTHRLEPFGHTLGVAMPTSGADFCAPSDGIPCGFSPFNGGLYCYDITPLF